MKHRNSLERKKHMDITGNQGYLVIGVYDKNWFYYP